jgi:hypothetical protein
MFKFYGLLLAILIRNAASSEEIEPQLVPIPADFPDLDAVHAHARRADLIPAADTVHNDKTRIEEQLVVLKVSRSALIVINVTDHEAESSAEALDSCSCTIRHVYRSIEDREISEDLQPLASATKQLLTFNTVSLESLPCGSYSLHLQCSKATCQVQPAGFRLVLNEEGNHNSINCKQQASQRSEAVGKTHSDIMHSTHSTHSTTNSESSQLDVQLLKVHLTQQPADNPTLQKLVLSTCPNRTQFSLEATLPVSVSGPLEDPAIHTNALDRTCNPATGTAVLQAPDATHPALVWFLRASLVSTSLLLTTRRSQACVAVIVHKAGLRLTICISTYVIVFPQNVNGMCCLLCQSALAAFRPEQVLQYLHSRALSICHHKNRRMRA